MKTAAPDHPPGVTAAATKPRGRPRNDSSTPATKSTIAKRTPPKNKKKEKQKQILLEVHNNIYHAEAN
jgi:hypothetical protein